MITVVGNLNTDLLLGPLAFPPAFGQEVFVSERSVRSGGQAFYAAVALAALDAPPNLIGDVGDDLFGAQIMADLRVAGVDTVGVRACAGMPTGLSVALLDENRDRAYVTHPGHLAAMDLTAVLARWDRVAGSRFLLFCGYCCLPGLRPEAGVALLRRAREEGIATVLDTGWDPQDWEAGGREELRRMVSYADIFMPNREEARILTGLDHPVDAANQLAAWGAATVIVKLGADGAVALHGRDVLRAPVLPTPVADTVGAGDCFDAGVLYALSQDWPLADALRLGTAVAGYAIADHSPRYPSVQLALAAMAQILVEC